METNENKTLDCVIFFVRRLGVDVSGYTIRGGDSAAVPARQPAISDFWRNSIYLAAGGGRAIPDSIQLEIRGHCRNFVAPGRERAGCAC